MAIVAIVVESPTLRWFAHVDGTVLTYAIASNTDEQLKLGRGGLAMTGWEDGWSQVTNV